MPPTRIKDDSGQAEHTYNNPVWNTLQLEMPADKKIRDKIMSFFVPQNLIGSRVCPSIGLDSIVNVCPLFQSYVVQNASKTTI